MQEKLEKILLTQHGQSQMNKSEKFLTNITAASKYILILKTTRNPLFNVLLFAIDSEKNKKGSKKTSPFYYGYTLYQISQTAFLLKTTRVRRIPLTCVRYFSNIGVSLFAVERFHKF